MSPALVLVLAAVVSALAAVVSALAVGYAVGRLHGAREPLAGWERTLDGWGRARSRERASGAHPEPLVTAALRRDGLLTVEAPGSDGDPRPAVLLLSVLARTLGYVVVPRAREMGEA